MKNKLLILFLLVGFQMHAQQILNIYSVPVNPTTADDIYILTDVQFNSGGCNVWQQSHSFFSAFVINAGAMHCLGPLAVICNYTDSFHLGPLAAGNYTFNFQLDNGYGGPPCTPGIVAGPTDSYNFTVSLPTGQQEIDQINFMIYPNPATSELTLQSQVPGTELIEIYNTFGQRVFSQQPIASSQKLTVDVSALPTGIYFLELKTEGKLSRKIFSVQR